MSFNKRSASRRESCYWGDSSAGGWADATLKKDKKSKKKGGILEIEEDPASPSMIIDVSDTAADDTIKTSWFSTGSSKKDKKGKKKNAIDEVKDEPVPTIKSIMILDNNAHLGENDVWANNWAGATSKKGKKNKKKGLASEVEEPAPVIEALPTIVDAPLPPASPQRNTECLFEKKVPRTGSGYSSNRFFTPLSVESKDSEVRGNAEGKPKLALPSCFFGCTHPIRRIR
jgi:hypothetical protein